MKNISSFREVSSGAVAPKSVGAICANISNRWAMACAGARNDQKYAVAQNSGGLSGPKPGA